MEELNFSLFWVIAIASFSIWGMGIYLVVKNWTEEKEALPFETIPEKEPEKQPVQEIKVEPPIQEKEAKLEELEIPIAQEKKIDIHTPEERSPEDFYLDFGKANIVEFPAEYIDDNSVKGLDGKRVNFVEFAKSCYTQIGFTCVDAVLSEKADDRVQRISMFDLACDHYTSDEVSYVNFFGRNKERFSDEIRTLKSNPEFVYKNMRELAAGYRNLPQLLVWNDRELFLVLVKSRHEELAREEIHWLREFIIQKRLFKARIFRIVEKKAAETPPAPEPPVAAEKITRKSFTKKEIEFLRENRGRMSNEEIARVLDRTPDSITHKLSRLGLSRETFEWTTEREKFLGDNLRRFSYKKLAEKLGTTVPSVRARCKKLGLKK